MIAGSDHNGADGGGGGLNATLAAAKQEALARNARHAAIALHKGGELIPEAR
jgi:hypothetical protein